MFISIHDFKMRRWKRLSSSLMLMLICALLIGTPTWKAAQAQTNVPADYQAIIDASKTEAKGLLIYSTMEDKNWAALLKGFNAKYPLIKVENVDLGTNEVISRYNDEVQNEARTADLLCSPAQGIWEELINDGELVQYKSIESANLPDWSKANPLVYTLSSDPMVIIWNKNLVADPPKTLAGVAALVASNPAAYKGRLTTPDARKSVLALESNWFWIKKNGETGWKTLETLGATKIVPKIRAKQAVESVINGETKIGYLVSFISVAVRLTDNQGALGWSLIEDGTPIIQRGMALTKHGASPNSAKLMLDFILSADGQIAFAEGGLTAYRDDVADKAKLHLTKLGAGLGKQSLIYMTPTLELANDDIMIPFLERWKKTYSLP